MWSSCAVFIYFVVEAVKTTPSLVSFLHFTANTFLIGAQGSMMIAFITGLYAVLAQSSALAISAVFQRATFLLFIGLWLWWPRPNCHQSSSQGLDHVIRKFYHTELIVMFLYMCRHLGCFQRNTTIGFQRNTTINLWDFTSGQHQMHSKFLTY